MGGDSAPKRQISVPGRTCPDRNRLSPSPKPHSPPRFATAILLFLKSSRSGWSVTDEGLTNDCVSAKQNFSEEKGVFLTFFLGVLGSVRRLWSRARTSRKPAKEKAKSEGTHAPN